jgi:Palmitoyl protein thioesterase
MKLHRYRHVYLWVLSPFMASHVTPPEMDKKKPHEISMRTVSAISIFLVATVTLLKSIVVWTGLGGSASHTLRYIREDVPEGPIVYAISLGQPLSRSTLVKMSTNPDDTYGGAESERKDSKAGTYSTINKQFERVCADILREPALSKGFNALGYSQGELMFRVLVQRCSEARVLNLITLGSPHAGVSGPSRTCDKRALIPETYLDPVCCVHAVHYKQDRAST